MRKVLFGIAVFLAAAMVSSNAFGVLFEDNFDSDPTGVPPLHWSDRYMKPGGVEEISREEAEAVGVTITVDENIFCGDTGKSVHFVDSSTSISGQIHAFFDPTATATLSYCMMSSITNDEGPFAVLRGNKDSSQTTIWSVGFRPDGYFGVHNSPYGWVVPDWFPYKANTWYDVTCSADTITDSLSFFVQERDNPTICASYSTIDPTYSEDYLYHVEIWTPSFVGANGYVDCVTVVPEPSSIILLGSVGAILLATVWRRRK